MTDLVFHVRHDRTITTGHTRLTHTHTHIRARACVYMCVRTPTRYLLFIPFVPSASVDKVYKAESFVTPVVLIFSVRSLQPGSERSLKEEEGGAPRYQGISESTKYTAATNPPASKYRDSFILYSFWSKFFSSSVLNLVSLSLNESNRQLFSHNSHKTQFSYP